MGLKKKGKVVAMIAIAAVALAMLATCKPVTYYLERVYKASGKVLEAGSKVPLESVEVFLHPYQYSVLTNGLGDYGIELSEGTWTLDYVKEGYITQSWTVTVNAGNPREKMDDVFLVRSGGSKLSGVWVIPSNITIPDGTYGYLKLVASGGSLDDPALSWTRSGFSGGSASYSIAGIAAGTYKVWAFIDMNANSPNTELAASDSADYFLPTSEAIIVSGDMTLDLGTNGWVWSDIEYVGTWVNPGYNGMGGYPSAKVVVKENSWEVYNNDTDTTESGTASLSVTSKWVSANGHCFQIEGTVTSGPDLGLHGYVLMCVSKNNTVHLSISQSAPPVEADLTGPNATVYARR